MKIFYCFVFFLITCHASLSQVLLDSKDSSSIAFAHVVSKNGKLLCVSRLDGHLELSQEEIARIGENDTLVVQHISYDNYMLTKQVLETKGNILMHKKLKELPEIIVNTNHDDEYLVLKGYYRSYELENGEAKFYRDGIVEYYISDKKIKRKLIARRYFSNKKMLEKEKQRSFMVSMRLAYIPHLNSIIPDKLRKKKEYTMIELSEFQQEVKKGNDVVGRVMKNHELTGMRIDMDFIAPEDYSTRSLFGYTGTRVRDEETETYDMKEFDDLTVADINSRKSYQKILFKYKKDASFAEHEGFNEIYIFDKAYQKMSKSEYKKIKPVDYFHGGTFYTDEYWNALAQYNIPAVNQNINRLLGTVLTE